MTSQLPVHETVHIERPDVRLEVGVRRAADAESSGPTIVLLHGLAGHRGEWDAVADCLDRAFPIVAPDLRCHGNSRSTSVAIDRAAYVADITTLIEHFSDEPVVLVGQSIGGVLATLAAQSAPTLVAHLILVEAGAAPITSVGLDGLAHWFASWPQRFGNRAEAAQFFGPENRSTPAWIAGLDHGEHGLTPRFDSDEMLRTAHELGSRDRLSELGELAIPITLLHAGDRGFLAATDIAEMQRASPQLDVREVARCGHDLHLDQPQIVALAIGAAARRVNGPAD